MSSSTIGNFWHKNIIFFFYFVNTLHSQQDDDFSKGQLTQGAPVKMDMMIQSPVPSHENTLHPPMKSKPCTTGPKYDHGSPQQACS